MTELRAEVESLRGVAAGGAVPASEAHIRELAAQLEDAKLCVPVSISWPRAFLRRLWDPARHHANTS